MSKQSDNRNIRVLPFLDAYEKQESLWNPLLESYKNKTARDEAYTQIIRELNVPSLTIQDVKLKVKSIRTTYTKELRLLTKLKEEGKPYNPKLFWFNRANSFLKNVSLSRDKRSAHADKNDRINESYKNSEIDYISDIPQQENFVGESTTGVLSNVEQDDPGNTSSTFEYKTLRASDIEAHMPDNMNIVEDHNAEDRIKISEQHAHNDFQHEVTTSIVSNKLTTTTATTNEMSTTGSNMVVSTQQPATIQTNGICDDEYDFFCRSVAVQLRSISDSYSRSVAKLKIQQILFEAETGVYRNTACITLPVANVTNVTNVTNL